MTTSARSPLDHPSAARRFVTTRFQGSKQRSFELLERALRPLGAKTAVDVFGGTGAVSWLLKSWGAGVTYNDALLWCHEVGTALIENAGTKLEPAAAKRIFGRRTDVRYEDFITRTFDGVFYLPEENAWLDVVEQNVARMEDRIERALAWYALFQACLKKRPFNLFHRANLAVRTRDVPRSFGNKATWERSFEELFLEALAEANRAVFDSGCPCRARRADATEVSLDADLVYLDPPYVRSDGRAFDYLDGYHFLEGLVEYESWGERIDPSRKHRPYARRVSPFLSAQSAPGALDALVARAHKAHVVAISYRADGVPSVEDLEAMLRRHGRTPRRYDRRATYALSRRESGEVVLVGERSAT
ncbi:MAG: DNA methyltransferase [Polyangiaceae bacterium]|nr:DNA methyltransferase [Polyangiaceae bacterium]